MSDPEVDESDLSVAELRARRQADAARRREAARTNWGDDVPGQWFVWLSVALTAVFVVLALVASVVDSSAIRALYGVTSLGLTAVGFVVCCVAMVGGMRRSARSEMTMAGWWFLTDSAPGRVRVWLFAVRSAQVVAAVGAASVHPSSDTAFVVLVPLLGIGCCGWWGAFYGRFPDRPTR